MSETIEITGHGVDAFLAAHKAYNEALVAAGAKPISGVPVGYFLDFPAIVRQASAAADRIRKRECERQKRDVPVEYVINLVGGKIVADVSYRA